MTERWFRGRRKVERRKNGSNNYGEQMVVTTELHSGTTRLPERSLRIVRSSCPPDKCLWRSSTRHVDEIQYHIRKNLQEEGTLEVNNAIILPEFSGRTNLASTTITSVKIYRKNTPSTSESKTMNTVTDMIGSSPFCNRAVNRKKLE